MSSALCQIRVGAQRRAPSLKGATDACVLASNNASPAQRGPRSMLNRTTPRRLPVSSSQLEATAYVRYFQFDAASDNGA